MSTTARAYSGWRRTGNFNLRYTAHVYARSERAAAQWGKQHGVSGISLLARSSEPVMPSTHLQRGHVGEGLHAWTYFLSWCDMIGAGIKNCHDDGSVLHEIIHYLVFTDADWSTIPVVEMTLPQITREARRIETSVPGFHRNNPL